jgi:predicted CXXCH cytochrome family protein
MKHIIAATWTACAVVVLALAGATGARAADEITASLHNLSTSGTHTIKATDTTEICIFCHFPHIDASVTNTGAPLWNRLDPTSTFSPYTSPTLDMGTGGGNTAGQPSGVSAACLSCHDGVGAIGGKVVVAPQDDGGDGIDMTQATITSARTSLGLDLTDDHPVSITYSAGTGAGSDPDFNTPSAGVLDANGTDIPLYNDGAGNFDQVECGSCHDPHSTSNGKFQRVANTGSQLCFACHDK